MVARILVATVLASLAGCYDPAPEEGAPCAPVNSELRCPTGLACVLRSGREICATGDSDLPDAGVDAPPPPGPGDRDGDGILDDRDDCPDVADPSQRDEDKDGVGDLCDPCPPYAGGGDSDGDGVGDACDPNPQTAGDKLVAFESFATPLPAPWKTTGNFTSTGGEGVAVAGADQSVLVTYPSPTTPRVEIRAAAVLSSITATGDFLGGGGLIERLGDGTDKGIHCQLVKLVNNTQQTLRIFDTGAGTSLNTAAHAFPANAEVEMRLRRNGTQYLCRATNPELEIAGTSATAPAGSRIGIRVRSAVMSYRWVMIVSSP